MKKDPGGLGLSAFFTFDRHGMTPAERIAAGRRGFTLVELLVVIGIIALLVGILLPTLRGVRARARMTQCASNLREIHNALVMYANDYNDRWPDPQTTGRFSYRMQPGMITPNDPAALPESYGLAAVLHGLEPGKQPVLPLPKARYLDGRSNVWVCPDQSDYFKSFGNTYAFSIANNLRIWNSRNRLKQVMVADIDNGVAQMVWDNFTLKPGLSGFVGPFNSYTIPTTQRTYAHAYIRKDVKGATNILGLDGRVDTRYYK